MNFTQRKWQTFWGLAIMANKYCNESNWLTGFPIDFKHFLVIHRQIYVCAMSLLGRWQMKRKASVYIQLFRVGNPWFRIQSLGNSSGTISSLEHFGENAEFLDEHCLFASRFPLSCWSQHISKLIKDQIITSKITGSFFCEKSNVTS